MVIERPIPVVQQVEDLIREQIRSGIFRPGERLPSESELSQEFGVSRATLRTVFSRLATEGMILRKQGDGTYVNERLPQVNVRQGRSWDSGELILASGFEPEIIGLSVARDQADKQTVKALGIELNSPVIRLMRLFKADGKPVILAENTIPALDQQPIAEIDSSQPLRSIISNYTHQHIGYAITDIRARNPDKLAQAHLDRKPSQPLLNIHVTFYLSDNRPIAIGGSWYDDATLRLRQVQSWT